MKKAGKILLLFSVLIISLLTLFACGGEKTYETRGITDIYVSENEVSREYVMKNVIFTDNDGKEVVPSLSIVNTENGTVLGENDKIPAGKYQLSYAYGNYVYKAYLYVYGKIEFVFGLGEEDGEVRTLSFSEAQNSLGFTKGITAKDTFGNKLEVTVKDGSDVFNGNTGEYTVIYRASDYSGQIAEEMVKYSVYSKNLIKIKDGSAYYKDDQAEFIIESLGGAKDGWLKLGDDLVNPALYEFDENAITVKSGFFRELPVGEYKLTFMTKEDVSEFKFELKDDGTPLFSIDQITNERFYSGRKNVIPMPVSEISIHNYEYSYELKNGANTYKVNPDGEMTKLNGDYLDAGYYTLKVTADLNGNKSSKEVDLTVWYSEFQLPTIYEKADLNNVYYISQTTFQGRAVKKHVKSSGNDVDINRIMLDPRNTEFNCLKFDFYVNECSEKTQIGETDEYLCNLTFTCSEYVSSNAIKPSYLVTDISGNSVDLSDLKMNTWYTILYDISGTKDATHAFGIYPTFKVGSSFEIYYADDIYANLLDEIDCRGTLTLSTGSTASVSDVLFDGEIVKSYKVLSDSDLEAGRLKFGNVDTTKPFLIAKIYIKSSDKQSGENAGLNTSFWTYNNYGSVGTGSFTETATGTVVANTALKMNTWYDLIVDFSGKSGTMDMFANNGAAIECEILFKDATVRETLIDDNKYTVTFDSDGGPSVPSQRLESGEKVAEPYGIVRVSAWEEYDFLGWYLGDEKWDFDNDTVEENITLKAKWKLVAKYGPEILP